MTKRSNALFRVACALALSAALAGCFDSGAGTGTRSKYHHLIEGSKTGTIERVAYATVGWEAPSERIDGTPLVDLSGFRVYYGRSPESLTEVVQVPGAAVRSARVYNLGAGAWYFAVTAVDADGVESERSAIATKTIG